MQGNEVLTDLDGLICIAARPAIGKTTFALNIVANITKDKRPSVIFSLDLSKTMILDRMKRPLEHLSIYDNILTIDGIENECRRLKAECNINLVVIDYLQLIKTDKQAFTKHQQIEDISKRLKELTEELNITIIVLSQLSKSLEEREDKRPLLTDLKVSSSIVEYADKIIFLYREDYYNKNAKVKRIEVIVAKDNQEKIFTMKREVQ